jgi:hypothetical protein
MIQHLLRCQGIGVNDYSLTLDALHLQHPRVNFSSNGPASEQDTDTLKAVRSDGLFYFLCTLMLFAVPQASKTLHLLFGRKNCLLFSQDTLRPEK